MVPSCYQHVFLALRGVHGRGPWTAMCPAHPDNRPSLSVAVGRSGKLVIRCHAAHGCTTRAILQSLRLTMDDLFPDNKQTTGARMERKFVCSYDYRDESGKLLFQACRYDPKGFSQRRPNAAYDPKLAKNKETNPEWIYSLEGVRRVLFMLPELIRAKKDKPERWIILCEGEKDCKLAWANGLVATCNPMGAGKWDGSHFNAVLKDCNVVLIPDEDPVDAKTGFSPGCRHMEDIANSLLGTAQRIRVMRLPGVGPKGDFSDWWANQELAGVAVLDRKKAMHEMVMAVPEWTDTSTILPMDWTKPPEPAKPASPSTTEWDGEITPGLQAIAEVAKDELVQFQGSMQVMAAKMQIEVGHVASALILNDKVDPKYLKQTLSAIGAMAAKCIEEIDKVKA